MIHKAIVRPYLDFADTVYDKAFNNSFHKKRELLK